MSFYENPDIKLRIDAQDMLEQGVLQKKGNYYHFNDEVIGASMDAVISFFKDVANQSIAIAAREETKKKKKK